MVFHFHLVSLLKVKKKKFKLQTSFPSPINCHRNTANSFGIDISETGSTLLVATPSLGSRMDCEHQKFQYKSQQERAAAVSLQL